MKFPGYCVSETVDNVCLERTTFDETELDPASDWKQAWQNQDCDGAVKGFVEVETALTTAATWLAKAEGRILTQEEADQARRFEPSWQEDKCEIRLLSQMLSSRASAASS